MLRALYEFKWYLLPKNDQKDVMFMIQRMQTQTTYSIGPFDELNFVALKVVSFLFRKPIRIEHSIKVNNSPIDWTTFIYNFS